MAQQTGPVPTIISVFRRVSTDMLDDLIARLDNAGYPGFSRSHHSVFENLDPAGTRLTELAARAGITQQSMSELVSVLELRGYLERLVDPTDRRARLVRLTPAGKRMARQALHEMRLIEADWRDRLARAGLSGDIVDALSEALTGL